MRPPIFILGVPRSGTSLTAQLVHAWGAHAGDMQQLHEADEWNKHGYYEHLPALAIIQRMLDGHLLPANADLDAYVEPARELVRAMTTACPDDRPWFWKIPAMTPLLPFWIQRIEEVMGTLPICIVVVRNPVASAQSQKRYFEQKTLQATAVDFPYARAFVVWQYYMAFLLNNTDPDRTIYVSMEDMLSNERAVVRLKEFLDRVYDCNGNSAMASIPQKFLVNQRDNALESLTENQRALYRILLQQTQSPMQADDTWHNLMPTLEERREIRAIEQWVGGKIAAKSGK